MKMKFWPEFVATLGGVGKVKKAPGTFGTLAFVPFVLTLSFFGTHFFYMAFTVFFIVIAVWASEAYGKGKDLKSIVVDEAAGLLVAMFLVPHEPKFWIIGILLFRLFDILKPFPISYMDKNVKGGFGVVLDDLVAGLFTSVLMHFVILKMPQAWWSALGL
jgi:phosphatidylglycerophosphatase A